MDFKVKRNHTRAPFPYKIKPTFRSTSCGFPFPTEDIKDKAAPCGELRIIKRKFCQGVGNLTCRDPAATVESFLSVFLLQEYFAVRCIRDRGSGGVVSECGMGLDIKYWILSLSMAYLNVGSPTVWVTLINSA